MFQILTKNTSCKTFLDRVTYMYYYTFFHVTKLTYSAEMTGHSSYWISLVWVAVQLLQGIDSGKRLFFHLR